MPLLKVSNVTRQIEDTVAVNSVSFTQNKLEKIAIAGETGSGKSTLLKMIAGLIQPDSGTITFNHTQIAGPDDKLVPGHANIAYLSQHFELQKFLRVEQVLEYANKLTEDETQTLFEICRIDHLLKRRTDELSGGEKQRIAIARLLISAPRLLLLDEPFSNLDMTQRNTLKTVLEDICKGLKITCILVSHDPQDVLTWADKVLIMRNGKIVQKGVPEHVYRMPVNTYTAGLFGKFSTITVAETSLSIPGRGRISQKELYLRPENLQLVTRNDKSVKGTITKVVFTGNSYELELATAQEELVVQTEKSKYKAGDTVYISLSPAYIALLKSLTQVNMRILVCDDDDMVIKVVQIALKDKNVELTIARDGQQGIDRLEKGEQFDLIVTDLHMPNKNGDDILKLVREDMKSQTPIVMFSSDGEEEVIALALKLGINDFIVKPITVDKFLKKIKKYLK